MNRFSQVCEVLLGTLAHHAESQNVALLRGLLGCLSVVLRVQPPAVWTQLSEAGKVFQSLLAYTAHSKPKIRKVLTTFYSLYGRAQFYVSGCFGSGSDLSFIRARDFKRPTFCREQFF